MIRRTGVLFVAILACSAASVQATLIDSFDVRSRQLYSVSRSSQFNSGQVKPGASVGVGGYRDLGLQWISGDTSCLQVFAGPDEPGLSFIQDAGQAVATLTWDGENSHNHLGYSLAANLTSGGNDDFLFDIANVTGNGMGLTMLVYTNAYRVSEFTMVVPAGTTGALVIPYSSFASVGKYGAADFSRVGAVVLELNGAGHAGSDIAINSIKTASPEPSTVVMAAVGLLAFFGLRRRRGSV